MDNLENIGIKYFDIFNLSGKLFEREEDFIVQEIEENGEILSVEKTDENIPKDKKDFLTFTLVKRGVSTPEAVKSLSKNLHISFKRIAYNGNKDKRALTSQKMSIFKFDAENLKFSTDRIFIRDLAYSNDPCKIGKLYGNHFTVKVRDFNDNNKDLDKLKEEIIKGIPNFYGPQRFGSSSLNIEVSKSILKKDFKTAFFLLVLKERAESKLNADKRKKLRETINLDDTNNLDREKIKEVLVSLPGFMYFERESIAYLLEHKNDYAGAIRLMPKYSRLIILQAFQYYVFNQTLSELLKEGYDEIPGDIPTIGYDMLLDEKFETIINGILEREGIGRDMFKISSMPEASLKSFKHPSMFFPEDFSIKEEGSDAIITFNLKKGSYATILLIKLFVEAVYKSS
jgi:tRNA pseudouridine13 synthase